MLSLEAFASSRDVFRQSTMAHLVHLLDKLSIFFGAEAMILSFTNVFTDAPSYLSQHL